eukprot:TRINITY_DN76993_c0_g1_i1.p1 TRINITY_DN76993_c0_g1~~TRINITY_DN76993_c0_g1_i1.p1  ORF type:complete len:187 (-),score=32.67 TRINITY_DN76993_c0_g1_i1:167-688(-)
MPTSYVLYIAVSEDGFVAGENDDMSWLDQFGDAAGCGYNEFIETVDRILMGRKTYNWILQNAGEKWPYEQPSTVWTSTELKDPPTTVSAVHSAEPPTFDNGCTWLCGGGQTIMAYLKAGLISSARLFTMPTKLGKGAPLFSDGGDLFNAQMNLTAEKDWPMGVKEKIYERKTD